MTQEYLLQIGQLNLFLQMVLTTLLIISHLINWFVLFNLSHRILKIKLDTKKIFIPILIMFIFSFVARPFLPASSRGPIIVIIFTLLLTAITGKINTINILKSAWTTLVTILTSGISSVFIVSGLYLLYPSISTFILNTILGNVLGVLFEGFFPFLAILILKKYPKITLVPPIEKINYYNTIGLLTFFTMFYTMYSASIKVYLHLINNSLDNFMELVSQWVAAVATILGTYLLLTNLKKKYESERLIYEERIAQLEQENQELVGLNEKLQANTIEPQEAVTAMQDIIKRLQNTVKITVEKREKTLFIEKISNQTPIYMSPREKEVITCIACGMSNKAIATALDLTEGTVKNIITKLLEKFELETRSQLVVYAVKNGLIDIKNND